MWTPDDSKIRLEEVIARLPPNDWSWTVLDFEGIGGEFNGYTPVELQQATRTAGGVEMRSSEFAEFALTIGDLWWIVAIAHPAEERIPAEILKERDFSRCVFVLEGEDSGWWIARSPMGDAMGDAALKRIRAVYAHLAL